MSAPPRGAPPAVLRLAARRQTNRGYALQRSSSTGVVRPSLPSPCAGAAAVSFRRSDGALVAAAFLRDPIDRSYGRMAP
jgi:hypothetical protein